MTINSNESLVKNFQQSFKNLFEEDYFNNTSDNANKYTKYVKKWNECRIDLKNYGNAENTLKILSSKNINVNFPKWLENEKGKGCVIKSTHNKLNITVQTIKKGQLVIDLRGSNYKSDFGSKIPIYINYKKLIVNNEIVFLENKLVSHDDKYSFRLDCENDQIIKIEIEFETIYDSIPDLNEYLSKFNDKKFTLENYKEFDNYIFKSANKVEDNDNILNLVSQLNDKLNDLYLDNQILKKELSENKKSYDTVLDSYNKQFSTIFLDYDLKPRGILKYTQELCVELLNFIVSLCKKYNLSYWLDFGTLLGARRHNGFIPWDDDVDIAMTRKDFDKFIEIIDGELKDNGLDDVIQVNIDQEFRGTIIPFVQLKYSADSRYLFAGLDIFPYDYIKTADDDLEERFTVEQQKFKRQIKKGTNRLEAMKEAYKNLNLSLYHEKYIIPGVDNTRGKYQRYSFDILETDKIFPLKQDTFYGQEYYVPQNADYYLKSIYKNYHTMPRIIEIHRRISDLKKNPENEEIFKKEILKMKEINQQTN